MANFDRLKNNILSTEYMISLVSDDFSRASSAYVGKPRGPRRMHVIMHSIPTLAIREGGTAPSSAGFLVLHGQPRIQCWCLKFRDRVMLAPVKHFHLVTAGDPSNQVSLAGQEQVMTSVSETSKGHLQGGLMEPFQAFAIWSRSYDIKPACE
ncbi:tubby-like F-box protein 5 [Elaeis guineensis]|uniref:tubby-like F-box protein 5 n=1 Tax=Elaeis guineensis var. tenera TaxID=51953 RepID=UPI003C6D3A51